MIKRTCITCFIGFFLISCASVGANQTATIEPIDGFTPQSPVYNEVSSGLGTGAAAEPNQPIAPVARQHRGAVTMLASVPGTTSFFSAGKDGFLELHTNDGHDESWQISDIPLVRIAVHPDGNRIAVYETDGFSIHRVSVWDWKEKTRLFAKRFRDSVTSLSWSAKGNWLMVGNTSLDGFTILEADTGKIASIFKTAPGIVTLGITGASETSMITFGPAGRIIYTDIANGSTRASYSGPQDLKNPVLLRNNLAIAGYQDGAVVLVDATTGKTITTWTSGEAIMATSIGDNEPLWIEKVDNAKWVARSGDMRSAPFSLPEDSPVTTALAIGDKIVFGTASGKILTIPSSIITSTASLVPAVIKDQNLQAIDDVASDGSRLFLLSQGSLFISSGPGKSPVFAFSGLQANRFAILGEMLIFWSSKTGSPVVATSFDGEKKQTLYEPKEGIRSLNINGTQLAFVEGTSKAIVIDCATGKNVFSYLGAGLQDAVLIGDNRIAVSRSSTARTPNPVMIINIATEETVALQIKGELCYGLRSITADGKKLAGFFIKDGTTATTELDTFTVASGTFAASDFRTEASYGDEDLGATILVDGDHLLTNLGKGSLVGIGGAEKAYVKFTRGYALPAKAAVMDQFTVTLNLDGSLTWFNRTSASFISNAAITFEGLWIEQ